jgi:hypothetical protein
MVKNAGKFIFIFFIVVILLSSWSKPSFNSNNWAIEIAGKEVMGNITHKLGDLVKVKRSTFTEDVSLSAWMYFCGSQSTNAECMIILTNQDGQTLAGKPITDGTLDFHANISGKEILSNPDFAKAERINVMFKIVNAETEGLNQIYVLGILELI